MLSLRKHTKGDTIVEVLVAIAIIGAALGSAYAISGRALKNGRAAQERTEALKLSETQIERLKQKIRLNTDSVFGPTITDGYFCLDASLTIQAITSVATIDSIPAACKSGFYGMYINKLVDGGNDFEFVTMWPQYGGGPQQSVRLVYRIYRNQ